MSEFIVKPKRPARLPLHYAHSPVIPWDRHFRELFLAVESVMDALAARCRLGGPRVVLNAHQRRLLAFRSAIEAADVKFYKSWQNGRFPHDGAGKLMPVVSFCDAWEDWEQARVCRFLATPRAERNGSHKAIVQAACHWADLRFMTLYVIGPDGAVRPLPRSRAALTELPVELKNSFGPALWGSMPVKSVASFRSLKSPK